MVLVTGTSSGFGQAVATALHARGDQVFGTTRAAAPPPGPFPTLTAEVGDEASVEAAVAQVVARAGRLDAVVANAGWGLAGAVEDTTAAEAWAQLDTNVLGVHRLCRAALPRFRAQGHGRIVIVGSLAGRVAIPFQAFYSASKFALLGYARALRLEVKPLGVQVCLVEPGDYATGFTAARRLASGGGPGSAYQARLREALEVMERDERANTDLGPVVRHGEVRHSAARRDSGHVDHSRLGGAGHAGLRARRDSAHPSADRCCRNGACGRRQLVGATVLSVNRWRPDVFPGRGTGE